MSHSSALLSAEPTIAKTVDHDASWDRVRRRLRAELGDDVFSSWFGRLELSGLAGETAHLSVPTRFLKSWIQSHYIDRLRALIFEEFIGLSEVVIAVRSATQKPAQKAQSQQAAETTTRDRVQIDRVSSEATTPSERVTTSETDSLGGAPLDRRLNFTNFLVG
ncbi:MAG: chromosomal replication initiator protein DnaA, partial [Alphaproteobacteria bacterium]|nr:chromosomal replication initiator protein DnaA [Alphaproteobacteria bacterium]